MSRLLCLQLLMLFGWVVCVIACFTFSFWAGLFSVGAMLCGCGDTYFWLKRKGRLS